LFVVGQPLTPAVLRGSSPNREQNCPENGFFSPVRGSTAKRGGGCMPEMGNSETCHSEAKRRILCSFMKGAG